MTPKLRRVNGRALETPEAIAQAMFEGLPLVGQTELVDEASARKAVIEYPIKTMNWHPGEKLWQSDTGPLLLPDLAATPEQWPRTIELAYIAANTADWADYHLVAALAGFVLVAWTYYAAWNNVAANQEVIARIVAQVQRIRRERGLDVA
jgi:hypothetical protein